MEQLLGLLNQNAPMKRIMRTMNMRSQEVTRHIYFIKYYRKVLEVKDKLHIDLKFSASREEMAKKMEERRSLRDQLSKLYEECSNELQRAGN